jgi:3-oxoacyl-[acyl-carrier protein] reductase
MGARTVLITGASRGIGRATAQHYCNNGYRVLTPSREELDLASRESIAAFLDEPANRAVDVLINNAAENPIATLDSLPLETFEHCLDVNLSAPLQLIQGVAPHMRAQQWGRIVNLTSCYAAVSRQGRASYGATKAGLNSLTRTACLEFASSQVLVNAVCPGFVSTDLTYRNNSPAQVEALCSGIPLGRLASPEEIAGFVYFLGSEVNTYITGQTLVIDGGFLCQ